MTQPLFHLAFPVTDLAKARAFYGGLLGCPEGRSSAEWVDFNWRKLTGKREYHYTRSP